MSLGQKEKGIRYQNDVSVLDIRSVPCPHEGQKCGEDIVHMDLLLSLFRAATDSLFDLVLEPSMRT